MVDPALVYVGGVVVLFFFWMYGIVAFVRDVKNKLLPAYRQWRRDDTDAQEDEEQLPPEDRYLEGNQAQAPSDSRDGQRSKRPQSD